MANDAAMDELFPSHPLLTPAHGEHCADCEVELPASELGRSWSYCEYCREAVCPACDARHACEPFRMKKNKIKKIL